MLLQWIATLSPQTRWCGTVGVLAVLASAFARFSARFASRSNVESDSKRKQQQAFDSKLCDVFWGFRPAAGEPRLAAYLASDVRIFTARDDMFTRIKWCLPPSRLYAGTEHVLQVSARLLCCSLLFCGTPTG